MENLTQKKSDPNKFPGNITKEWLTSYVSTLEDFSNDAGRLGFFTEKIDRAIRNLKVINSLTDLELIAPKRTLTTAKIFLNIREQALKQAIISNVDQKSQKYLDLYQNYSRSNEEVKALELFVERCLD